MGLIIKYCIYFLIFFEFIYSQETFQSVRVFNPNSETLDIIGSNGIPLDHITGKKNIYIDITATETQVEKLLDNGLILEILIDDLTSHYLNQNIPAVSRDFPLGSMQGNYTLDELNNRFDELQNQYPDIISNKYVISQSIEGRDIWAFKVSDNPEQNEDEPEVLFTALTHSREPLGMMNLIYFVQKLCEDYNEDPELTYLVQNRELWFIPVVNPDGYVYNESIAPNGGGMHRKNRLDTDCGNGTERGVDLNRNFGYGWGANNTGSSPDPCSSTYRGSSAFSEPETQAIRSFILDHEFKNILHYHSYSNVYIHAFGNASLPDEPDLTIHRELGQEMALYNGYEVGTGYETIGYTVNGDAVDWTYGQENLIAFTPEVGSPSQGFWPPENDVISLCSDQLHPNKTFAFVSGSDLIVHDYSFSDESILPGTETEIDVLIKNRGFMESGEEIEISIVPLDGWLSLDIDSYTMNRLVAQDEDSFSFQIGVPEIINQGVYSGIAISIEDGFSFTRHDTIRFLLGEAEIIFFDGFENGLNNWNYNGDWGLTNDADQGNWAFSDSPEGNYSEAQETIAELPYILDLSFLSIPMVTFKAKWDIESNYDFVRFQAFVPGEGWISLEGNFTDLGVGQPAQPLGEFGYDGSQAEWINEVILLNQIPGNQISSFRFIQTSDNYVEGDGFIIDNFTISGFPGGLLGDFNSDFEIDLFDILGLADMIIFGEEPTALQLYLCDLNSDGNIGVMDLIELIDTILGF